MKLDANTFMKALDPIYDKALDGIPGFLSVEEMAEDYLSDLEDRKNLESLKGRVDTLIRWQVTKASTSGFLTGLGGILTLPVAIPANLSSVMYVQLRMVAAVAYAGGYDVRNDRVKTLCYTCLCGNTANEVLKGVGITAGTKLTQQAIKRLSFEAIKKVNKAVGFRLVTKFGQTGVVNLGKAIPLAGGVVGGTFDGAATYTIGKVAKNVFLADDQKSAQRKPSAYHQRSNQSTADH